jgi:hypothetical protein
MLSTSEQEVHQYGSYGSPNRSPVAIRNEVRRSSPSTPNRLSEDELLAIRLTEEGWFC